MISPLVFDPPPSEQYQAVACEESQGWPCFLTYLGRQSYGNCFRDSFEVRVSSKNLCGLLPSSCKNTGVCQSQVAYLLYLFGMQFSRKFGMLRVHGFEGSVVLDALQ